MHSTEPKVYLLAESNIHSPGLDSYLTDIQAGNWTTDTTSDLEELTEVASRSCYMSFGPDINPNVTRVREGNRPHLANIIESGHGSVLEHAWVTFAFRNISRVCTHELVRHRTGTAISQESLRFVRFDYMGQWIPEAFRDNEQAVQVMDEAWKQSETHYKDLLYAAAVKEGVESFDALPLLE